MYYPSLHHISVEVEDGKTADRKPVKYGFDLNMFPSYSWKGYVNFLPEQVRTVIREDILSGSPAKGFVSRYGLM